MGQVCQISARVHNRVICRHNIDCVYTGWAQKNHFVILAKHRTAPWWWFLREPKHVGASIIILKLFQYFHDFKIVCIIWNNKSVFNPQINRTTINDWHMTAPASLPGPSFWAALFRSHLHNAVFVFWLCLAFFSDLSVPHARTYQPVFCQLRRQNI
jgi:hypothetical protein